MPKSIGVVANQLTIHLKYELLMVVIQPKMSYTIKTSSVSKFKVSHVKLKLRKWKTYGVFDIAQVNPNNLIGQHQTFKIKTTSAKIQILLES